MTSAVLSLPRGWRAPAPSAPPPDTIRCGAAVLRPSCVHRCRLTGRTTGRFAPLDRAAAHREFGANETRRPPDVDGSQPGTKFRSELPDRKPLQFLESRPGVSMPPNHHAKSPQIACRYNPTCAD